MNLINADLSNELFIQQDSTMLLGELLLQLQVINRDQLTIALQEQKISGRLLGEQLLHLAFIDEKVLLSILAVRFHLPVLIDPLLISDEATLACLSAEEVNQYHVFPITFEPETQHLMLAVSQMHPFIMQLSQQYTCTLFLTSHRHIQQALHRHYWHDVVERLSEELEWGEPQLVEDTAIMIRFVNALLTQAICFQASDLHCEPEMAWINLRYRIDGVLRTPRQLHRRHWSALSVRLKLMAGLDIAETRANQEGRIAFSFASREIDCRVSIIPTLYGENIVIRFLAQSEQLFTLPALGFTDRQQDIIHRILRRPQGITLVVGPTGSGKTTTLYTLLQQFDCLTHNIMTLEDPVEYRLPGVRQINLPSLNKLDFANGVRAILRQAPDIILIGEIRDQETAIAALQASMTGHRVLASVHAKSAMGAITRLTELGIPSAHIAANVVGLIGQRLLRRLCQHCKESMGLDAQHQVSWQASGCSQCQGTGFRGRIVVSEALYMDVMLETQVHQFSSEIALRVYQQQQQLSSMIEDATYKLQAGIVSESEIARMLDLELGIQHAI